MVFPGKPVHGAHSSFTGQGPGPGTSLEPSAGGGDISRSVRALETARQPQETPGGVSGTWASEQAVSKGYTLCTHSHNVCEMTSGDWREDRVAGIRDGAGKQVGAGLVWRLLWWHEPSGGNTE